MHQTISKAPFQTVAHPVCRGLAESFHCLLLRTEFAFKQRVSQSHPAWWVNDNANSVMLITLHETNMILRNPHVQQEIHLRMVVFLLSCYSLEEVHGTFSSSGFDNKKSFSLDKINRNRSGNFHAQILWSEAVSKTKASPDTWPFYTYESYESL